MVRMQCRTPRCALGVWRWPNFGRLFRGCFKLRSSSRQSYTSMSKPQLSPGSWYSTLLTASARRDGAWKNVPAAELVRGDTVKLSLGGVVAADVKLVEGSILLDQSMLTGESVPIEAGPGLQTYAGALVRRGEATAIVTATGATQSLDIPPNSSAPPMS